MTTLRIFTECGALNFFLEVIEMKEFNQMTLNYGEEFQVQLNDKKQKIKLRPSSKNKPILKASINQLEDKKFSVDLDVENMVEEDLLPPPLKCPVYQQKIFEC